MPVGLVSMNAYVHASISTCMNVYRHACLHEVGQIMVVVPVVTVPMTEVSNGNAKSQGVLVSEHVSLHVILKQHIVQCRAVTASTTHV